MTEPAPEDATPAGAAPGVGLDLLEIERLERALARRPRLAERLFTEDERAYAAARARPGQHLAARFCAKEAVAKALGLESLAWREIEVVSPPRGGVPEVVLHGETAARARALGVAAVRVSLTHTRGQAGAVVIIELGTTSPTPT
ncbi:MAG TPA: holo-ACP synthase [Solirubrobacteraceae bacterium]|nr:holo-ACP synthase [Solirubrobacteraceae bacterium]